MSAHKSKLPERAASDDRFRDILEHTPAMIWTTGPDGSVTYINSAWYEFTGQSEPESLGSGWLTALHPDDRVRTRQLLLEAHEGRRPFQAEHRLHARSGVYRWVLATGAPRFSATGKFEGYVGSVVDIHARREVEDRFRALTSAVPAIVWLAAPHGDVQYLNDRWYEFTGQTPQEALPTGWTNVIHPDDLETVVNRWREARALGQTYAIECRYRRWDGAYRWYMVRAEPLRGENGAVAAWIGTAIDITDRKVAEERQALLVNELNHRVKNTLASVQALASQTLQTRPEPAQFREAFEDRLISLARAHDLLTASGWAGARLGDVVARAAAPWPASGFEVQGPEVWLEPQQALSVAIALHELATNAAKYGALSVPGGKVTVGWDRQADGPQERVRLRWTERGGPPVAPPARRGFGSRLLERGLGRELHGEVTLLFPPEGAECRIDFPLRSPVEAAQADLAASGPGSLAPPPADVLRPLSEWPADQGGARSSF